MGNALGCRRDADEVEVAQKLVVTDELSLSLVDLNLDGSLAVGGGGESLRLLGGDGGVSGDKLGHDTTEGLDT